MNCFTTMKFRVFVLVAAGVLAGKAFAQDFAAEPMALHVTGLDQLAAATLTSGRYHMLLTKRAKAAGISPDSLNVKLKTRTKAAVPPPTLPSPPAGTFFYPDLLAKTVSTGSTITTAAHHPIYINCAASCWGTPATFLTNLDASAFLHITDQYTGATTNGRYTVGTAFSTTMSIFAGTSGVPTLGENDLLGLVHAAALKAGSGYGHIYHIFIPTGVDTCMDEGPCYSPDNLNTFVFCAYHYTATFSDIASPVYYTVEPFQGQVPTGLADCSIPTTITTPNGVLIDSTATTLLHETVETITDPDINTGFRAVNSNYGEIGDICEGFLFKVTLNGKAYATQAIYSNKYQACATTP